MGYRFIYISLVATALGCRGSSVTSSAEAAPAPSIASLASARASAGDPSTGQAEILEMAPMRAWEPKPLGNFLVTFYYVVHEDDVRRKRVAALRDADGAELAAVTDRGKVGVYDVRGCKEITRVSREFAFQLTMQGSGRLRDGRVLTVSKHCKCQRSPCFSVTKNPWGTSGTSRPLQPFRTVAVDPKVVRLGTLLHIPELEGRTMPGRAPWGGFVHDGCVLADDTGGNIGGKQLDLFVGRKAYYHGLARGGSSHAWARSVAVYDGSRICERNGRHVSRRVDAI